MPMSRYNRENPFMYLLENKNDEFDRKCMNMVKKLIVMLILTAIDIVLYLINAIIYSQFSFVTLICKVVIAFIISIEAIDCVSILKKDKSELNEIIFSDQYKHINLNNEKILAEINQVNESIGRVISINRLINSMTLLNGFIIGCYIARILGGLLK